MRGSFWEDFEPRRVDGLTLLFGDASGSYVEYSTGEQELKRERPFQYLVRDDSAVDQGATLEMVRINQGLFFVCCFSWSKYCCFTMFISFWCTTK